MKTCATCHEAKSIDEFWKHPRAPDGLQYHCKPCQTLLRHNPQWRSKRYGITQDQLDTMYKVQDYRCAVCQRHQNDSPRKILCIDHDHRCCPGPRSCGRCVRGLLCINCNYALGQLRDDPKIVQRLAEYLSNYMIL